MPPIQSFQIKRANLTPEGKFSGVAAVFSTPDRGGDVIVPGAFQKSIQRLDQSDSTIPLLWQHKADTPIGWISSMSEKSDGLHIEGALMMDLQHAKTAYGLIENRAGYLSIGYVSTSSEPIQNGRKLKAIAGNLSGVHTDASRCGYHLHQVRTIPIPPRLRAGGTGSARAVCP